MEKDPKKVTVNIFTNCSGFACIELIALSTESFYKAFQASKESPVRIFVDPHPNVDRYEDYVSKIESWAKENLADCSIIKTRGLSDGYIKAINMASTPYCFLTVHDVYYIPEYIDHDIFEMMDNMDQCDDVEHLRFNKRANWKVAWDMRIADMRSPSDGQCMSSLGMPCCENGFRADATCLVKTEHYKDHVKFLDPKSPTSSGVEKVLHGNVGGVFVYGAPGHPLNWIHLNGKIDSIDQVKEGSLSLSDVIESHKKMQDEDLEHFTKMFGASVKDF